MTFSDAVASALTQYVGFRGRARRSEYWWFFLFLLLVSFVAQVITAAGASVVALILELALFLPMMAVTVRRLHDTDRSGWWILLGLIPVVGSIVVIVWLCQDGNSGPNRFGDSPKDSDDSGEQSYRGQSRSRRQPPHPGHPIYPR